MFNLPTTVSLFCGAGGESAGKELAFKDLGIDTTDWRSHAVNHWNLAVATHGANFPNIHVHQEDITQVTAASFGVKHIDLLWASPSCVHHSRARGGKPCEDQQRSHADEVVDRWLKVASVDVLLIENVPEFAEWGPLDAEGHPIKERKGEFFRRFLGKLKALGYKTEHRILCAADFGDPTTRRRFFMQAVKDGISIVWPEPTHRDPRKGADMFTGHLPTWRTAAECIDWSIPCPSIFDRKKPLAEATLRRIAAGVVRYVLESKRPYIVNLTHGGRLEDLAEPLKTVTTANRGEKALVVPTLVGVGGRAGQSRPRSLDEPFATTTAKADTALVAANMVSLRGTSPEHIQGCPSSMEDPLKTVSAGGGHAALVATFLSKFQQNSIGSAMDEPVHTVMAGAPRHALIAASLIQAGYGERDGQAPRVLDIEAPLGTVVAGGCKHGLVAANIIGIDNQSGAGIWSAADPLTTSTTKARHALVAAFIQHYYGTGGQHQEPGQPLHTITTLARHGLVTVEIDGETYLITDICMRMLEPKELAKAMGFPDDYQWTGEGGKPLTKRDQVKMIGNACPVHTVAELIKAVVLQRPKAFGMPKEAVA